MSSSGRNWKQLVSMSSWPIVTFEDAPINIIDGDRGVNYPKQSDFSSFGHCAFLNASNVTGSGFNFTKVSFIDRVRDRLLRKGKLKLFDSVLTTRGTVGNVGFLDQSVDFEHVRINSGMVIFRPDQSKIVPRFLYLFLRSRFFKGQVSALTTGSAQPQLPIRDIKRINICLPSIAAQHAIAETLGALDDKIDLNRHMNETLEAMARAIFKDWFVDFGPTRAKAEGRAPYLAPELWDLFPDALDDERKPVGWTKENLGTLFDVSIGRTPPRKERQHFVVGGTGVTWLSIKAMRNIQTFALSSDEDLTPSAVTQFRVPLIPAGTVIVSFKLTVGRVAIAANDMHSNEAIAHLVENIETRVASIFTYCFMKDFDYDTLSSTSSIATAVNSKSIKAIEMIVPDSATHSEFVANVRPLFDRILCNLRETEILSATRDLLLPKLISGEIRLREAEQAVEAVA